MKVRLEGKNLDELRVLLPEAGMCEAADPELIVTHGGDGALLGAARGCGALPILPLRSAEYGALCPRHSLRTRLLDFVAGRCQRRELRKIQGRTGDRKLSGINDIFLHNLERSSALRYRVRINGVPYAWEIVGDGVGVASVHGSTGYYRSITHSNFSVGIGLAFSNSTEEVSHLVLDRSAVVEVEVVRGPGLLVADNDPEQIVVREGGVVTLCESAESVTVYGLEEFMCPDCRALRHPGKPVRG